jgi:hypothetical protein
MIFVLYYIDLALNSGASQDLLPLRLQNSSASNNARLRYPPGFAMVAQAPVHKQDLLLINGELLLDSVLKI